MWKRSSYPYFNVSILFNDLSLLSSMRVHQCLFCYYGLAYSQIIDFYLFIYSFGNNNIIILLQKFRVE
jgi:hypothetical protein